MGRWHRAFLCLLPAIAGLPSTAGWAQEVEVRKLEGLGGIRADTDTTDVFINDSFEASDAISKARRLARAERWVEAAELLQQASDTVGDKLVRISQGYYVGLREHVSDLIAEWPQEGIAAYRALNEREIVAALAEVSSSRSVDEYLVLFNRYFCTSAAAELAEGIAQLAIEAGDFALAEHVYRRVLEAHPDATEHRPRYEAMLVLLRTMHGDGAAAVSDADARLKIRWMGQDRTIGEVLRGWEESFRPSVERFSALNWPVFAGDEGRNRPATTGVDELGLLWRFKGSMRPRAEQDAGLFDRPLRGPRDRSRDLTIHPVVSGNLVYVQRYREVIALHRNTGVVAWRYRADDSMATDLPDIEEPTAGWNSATVHDGRLYVALPGDVVPYYGYESAQTPPELLCLDADTGRLIWPKDRQAAADRFPEISFDSAPLVRQGRLYIVGRRRRSFGFEDCYLFRFNATTGALDFKTHLGSASTGTFGSRQVTMAVAAMHGDTVFVCTNLGTIAAVSAPSGAVRWLRRYAREVGDDWNDLDWGGRRVDPWAFNPVIRVADDTIVCLPTDGAHVLVLAEDDGRLLRAIPVNEFGDIETLLGVREGLLCGVGKEAACYDLAAGSLRWSAPFPMGTNVFGRGVWADERLLVPTRDGLSIFGVADGERTDLPWDTGGQGGNLLAMPDQLLVAGPRLISAYVRKAELWNTLRERMAAAPADPLPALELAEVALQGGELTEAVQVLDEAVRRAGAFADPLEPALKRRFFDDVLMFVDVFSSEAALEAEILDKLFTYASQCPPDRAAHLDYRFRFGGLFEERDQPDRALRLYQQILRDRSLREDRGDAAAGGPEPGGVRAQERIARLIELRGRVVYAPFETEARRWLESGRAAEDETALGQVVAVFPNSTAAPQALEALAESAVRSGRLEEAATCFARAYHRYPKQVDRPALLRKIADAYEQAGQPERAYRWLTKAARHHPSSRFEHEGRLVSFADYRARLSHVSAKVEPSRPRLALPLANRFVRDLEGPIRLLLPWFGDKPGGDWSRYFVAATGGIRSFDARTNAETWEKPVPARHPPDLLVATPDVAVFANKYEVFGVDMETGARRWSNGEYPAGLDAVIADWEDDQRYRAHVFQGDRLISVRDDGLVTCIKVNDGRVIWSQTHRPIPGGRVRLTDRYLVYSVAQGAGSAVQVIDAATGDWLQTVTIDEPRSIEDLLVTIDGQLVIVTSRSLSGYDLETASRRWHVVLDGYVRPAALIFDLDAVYLSDDGRQVQKLSLEDGSTLWRSEDVVRPGDENPTATLHGDNLIVSTSSSIGALDVVNGMILWQGVTSERPRLSERTITQSYVLALDMPEEPPEADGTAYFFDHRNASGVIPRNGGTLNLGRLEEVKAVLVSDGALLIQTGSTIHGWTE